MALSFNELEKSHNIAELLDEQELAAIGNLVVKGYEIDEESRAEWKETIDKAMDIAKQIMEIKTFPWYGAANIKMPIVTKACIEYASRTLPEIIQNEKIVKGVIVGQDPYGAKELRINNVCKYMSYKLINESPDWESGMDSLLQTLPVLGTVFKKTYYNTSEKRCVSEMCVPDKIVVNYRTQSLETARRITHILVRYQNDIIENQRRGLYRDDIEVKDLLPEDYSHIEDSDFPICILEQHCYLDLDDDGYKEPYIVTVHKETKKVLRIVSRFEKVEKKDGKIVCIKPTHYFTDFHFIRSPDGGFYSMGFGSLLLPLNTTVNTLVNQLLDAGTINNVQGGFIGRGLRIKNGDFQFRMGEWKVLDTASGTKLADNIYQLPTREPSQTLFQLLGLMLQEAKDLSSTTDVLLGKQPAQNVASNTISQLVEQGTKIFAAINKRVYRGLKKEYQKLYSLFYYYGDNEDYKKVLDIEDANIKADFELDSLDIYPVADPVLSSDQQKLMRSSIIMQLPTIDRRAADELVLDSMQLEDSLKKKLLPPIDPNAPPPPDVQKTLAEVAQIEAKIQNMNQETVINIQKMQLEQLELQKKIEFMNAQIEESLARIWKMQKDAMHNDIKDNIQANKMTHEKMLKEAKLSQENAFKEADLISDNYKANLDAQVKLTLKDKDVEKAPNADN